MSDLYMALGFIFCFAAGVIAARTRPLAQARDWAAWVLDTQPDQPFWRDLLVRILLVDRYLSVWLRRDEFPAIQVPDYWED